MSAITVIDVFRDLGIEPETPLTWIVGAAVRQMWESERGALPEKLLRQKTNGTGSHCFAAYPKEWRPRIVAVILEHQTEKAKQGDFFL